MSVMILGQGDTERELERDMRNRLVGAYQKRKKLASHLCWAIRQAMYRELRALGSRVPTMPSHRRPRV